MKALLISICLLAGFLSQAATNRVYVFNDVDWGSPTNKPPSGYWQNYPQSGWYTPPAQDPVFASSGHNQVPAQGVSPNYSYSYSSPYYSYNGFGVGVGIGTGYGYAYSYPYSYSGYGGYGSYYYGNPYYYGYSSYYRNWWHNYSRGWGDNDWACHNRGYGGNYGAGAPYRSGGQIHPTPGRNSSPNWQQVRPVRAEPSHNWSQPAQPRPTRTYASGTQVQARVPSYQPARSFGSPSVQAAPSRPAQTSSFHSAPHSARR